MLLLPLSPVAIVGSFVYSKSKKKIEGFCNAFRKNVRIDFGRVSQLKIGNGNEFFSHKN